jgi:peptidoglycan/LPS O-acetylase OafA/YrhL
LEIEALRGLAIAGVVLHHLLTVPLQARYDWIEWLEQRAGFWTGVDLFFAISGYVIARSLFPLLKGPLDFPSFLQASGSFWIRRAFRLLPSAWLWLLLIMLATIFFNRSGAFGSVQANLAATVAGIAGFANFRFAECFMRCEYGASFVWWSLSLEQQFYLLLPFAIFVLGRFLPWGMVALVVIQFPLLRTVFMMATRTDAILLGVLLAWWQTHGDWNAVGRRLAIVPPVVWLGLSLALVVSLSLLGGAALTFWPWRIGCIAVVSAVLVWLAAQDRGFVVPAGSFQRVATWVGMRSYAIYLVHIPAFFLTREIWFRLAEHASDAVIATTGLGLTLIFAEANWRLVENPIRAWGARIATSFRERRTSGTEANADRPYRDARRAASASGD